MHLACNSTTTPLLKHEARSAQFGPKPANACSFPFAERIVRRLVTVDAEFIGAGLVTGSHGSD